MNDFHPPTNTNDTDHILESLRPRMHEARIAHVRRLTAGVLAVPLLGFGVAAMAASGEPSPSATETAAATVEELADDASLPEIGASQTEESETEESETEESGTEESGAEQGDSTAGADLDETEDTVETITPSTTTTAPSADAETDPNAPTAIDLGALGWVQVQRTDDGFAVASSTLTDGWEVTATDAGDGSLTLVVSDGETTKVVAIVAGARDEILVSVDEFAPPTTTTTTVKPVPIEQPNEEAKTEPKDSTPVPTPVTDRFTVDVPGKGSFVVERDGDTLYLGAVTVAEGYTYDIHKDAGWKVYVGFSNGETIFYGKALINDNGEVEQHFWDENIGPVPTYQWVEIPGVGAAKFEFFDGQIRVFKTEVAEGFTATDANGGGSSGTGRVIFSGEGVTWLADAWINGNGELATGSSPG